MRAVRAYFHLLDRQLIDADGVNVGKADDLELDLSPGHVRSDSGPPRVLAILANGGWRHPPARIDLALVRDVGSDIKLLLRADELATHDGERWIRDHVIGRLPGADHESS